MHQRWHDLLFVHRRVAPGALAELVPTGVEVETFDGSAWIGVVPFRMTNVRPRGAPGWPGATRFPELNVRTYVRAGGKPGVAFLSLDATSGLAVAAARRLFHLPYYRARMACEADGEGLRYRSERTHRGAAPAAWRGRYRPTGPPAAASPGTLEHFLTERYCLYTSAPDGALLCGEVHHVPWPLQPAEAEIELDTMATAGGVEPLDGPPHLLFSRRLDVVVWRLARA